MVDGLELLAALATTMQVLAANMEPTTLPNVLVIAIQLTNTLVSFATNALLIQTVETELSLQVLELTSVNVSASVHGLEPNATFVL